MTKLRTGTGMLLYLVKHSRPDLNNAVRELYKVMDGATTEHLKLPHRVIKFVECTKTRGIMMKPNADTGVRASVDSDNTRDWDNRRWIAGYLVYLSASPSPGSQNNK